MKTIVTATKKELEEFVTIYLPQTSIWDKSFDYFINEKKDFFEGKSKLDVAKFVRYIESQLGLYFKNTSLPSMQISNNSIAVFE